MLLVASRLADSFFAAPGTPPADGANSIARLLPLLRWQAVPWAKNLVVGALVDGFVVAFLYGAACGRASPVEAASRAVSRLPSLVGAEAIMGTIFVAPLVLLQVAVGSHAPARAALWWCVFAPQIYLLVRLTFWREVIVVEAAGLASASRRSWNLARRNWWRLAFLAAVTGWVAGIVLKRLPAYLSVPAGALLWLVADAVMASAYPSRPESSGPPPVPDARGAAMLRRALSLVFWVFLVVSSIVLFPVAVLIWALTAPFDRRRALLHRFTCFWASLYTWLNPAWRVRVEGRERIRPDAAYVMVANHQSLLDILVLFRLFVHFKWVSKIENFRVPFIGWNMALNRYIKLRRGSRESVARALHACERALAQGSSIMMFPEGTRSPDGRLRAFKPGAFTLAQRTGAPILPIVIEGTASALPKRGFVLQGRHAIRVRVLDEIPHASFATEPVEAVTEAVRERFVSALGARAERG